MFWGIMSFFPIINSLATGRSSLGGWSDLGHPDWPEPGWSKAGEGGEPLAGEKWRGNLTRPLLLTRSPAAPARPYLFTSLDWLHKLSHQ